MDQKINYFKEAFKLKTNLLCLTGGIIASFFTPIPFWIFIGAVVGLEILFLTTLSSNKRFKRVIRAKKHQEFQQKEQRRLEGDLFRMNTNQYRHRYTTIKKNINNIWRHFQRTGTNKSLIKSTKENMDKLRVQFLRLIFSLNTLDSYLNDAGGGKINADISKLESDLQSASGSLKNIKEQRINILKKRKQKLGKANENKEVIVNQLEVIDETIKYLLEGALTSKDPDQVSNEIERITDEAEVASESIADLENFINLTSSFGESEILAVSEKIKNF